MIYPDFYFPFSENYWKDKEKEEFNDYYDY